jgi:hypothetical protein
MVCAVSMLQNLRPKGRRSWHKNPPLMKDETICLCPALTGGALTNLLLLGEDLWQGGCLLAKCNKVQKIWSGQSMGSDPSARFVLVAAGQSIRGGVLLPGLVLHCEAVTKQFTHPSMLRNHGEALIQGVLEAAVISADNER